MDSIQLALTWFRAVLLLPGLPTDRAGWERRRSDGRCVIIIVEDLY